MSKQIFKCYNCNLPISPHKSNCPNCGKKQSYESRAKFLNRQLVNIKCKKCGGETSFYSTSNYFDLSFCADCGAETSYNDEGKIKLEPAPQKPKCPYCNSINVKKISNTSKVAHGITFGLLATSKIINQWHCNNCKSDF